MNRSWANTNKHLQELRPGLWVMKGTRASLTVALARSRLASTGRTCEQRSLEFWPQGPGTVWGSSGNSQLHDLQLGFFTTSHVCKPHTDVILDDLGYCLTNAKEPPSPTTPQPPIGTPSSWHRRCQSYLLTYLHGLL